MPDYKPLKRQPHMLLTLSLLFLTASSTGLYAQFPDNSPLSPEEKRQVLLQLHELQSLRETVGVYEQYVARDREQDAREKANYERSLQLEREATKLATERAEFYEQAFRSVTRKPGGFGCVLRTIFTLGLSRCK